MTLDLDREHKLNADWLGKNRVKVWWRTGHFPGSSSVLRFMITSDGRAGRRADGWTDRQSGGETDSGCLVIITVHAIYEWATNYKAWFSWVSWDKMAHNAVQYHRVTVITTCLTAFTRDCSKVKTWRWSSTNFAWNMTHLRAQVWSSCPTHTCMKIHYQPEWQLSRLDPYPLVLCGEGGINPRNEISCKIQWKSRCKIQTIIWSW